MEDQVIIKTFNSVRIKERKKILIYPGYMNNPSLNSSRPYIYPSISKIDGTIYVNCLA